MIAVIVLEAVAIALLVGCLYEAYRIHKQYNEPLYPPRVRWHDDDDET